MKIPSACFDSELPLADKGVWEQDRDWVGVWEGLADRGPAVFLESGGPLSDASQWHILAGDPAAEFIGAGGQAWLGAKPSPFGFEEFVDRAGRAESSCAPLPFCLSKAWFGILSYEFGRNGCLSAGKCGRPEASAVRRAPGPDAEERRGRGQDEDARPDAGKAGDPAPLGLPDAPDFYFFKPRFAMAFHRGSREYFLFGETPRGLWAPGERRAKNFRVGKLEARSGRGHYESIVRRAKAYIAQGDIYQANLSQSFRARWAGGASGLYRDLREINPGPFMGIFQGRGFTVVSSSPERLAAGEGGGLETRPIAGTRPRLRDEARDLQSQAELKTRPKELAEHLMLVDLARNDLGRVSLYGSVEVKRYAEVESYSKVHHLVSLVEGIRRPAAGLSEILKSLFPGGTITGCPKVRCMQIIGELERRRRGFYTGSMGYAAPGPKFDFNILIRSFTLFAGGRLEFCAGAGIVADSDPGEEYLETLYKAEALARVLGTSLVPDPT